MSAKTVSSEPGGRRGIKTPAIRSPMSGAVSPATAQNTMLISPTRQTSAFWIVW